MKVRGGKQLENCCNLAGNVIQVRGLKALNYPSRLPVCCRTGERRIWFNGTNLPGYCLSVNYTALVFFFLFPCVLRGGFMDLQENNWYLYKPDTLDELNMVLLSPVVGGVYSSTSWSQNGNRGCFFIYLTSWETGPDSLIRSAGKIPGGLVWFLGHDRRCSLML